MLLSDVSIDILQAFGIQSALLFITDFIGIMKLSVASPEAFIFNWL